MRGRKPKPTHLKVISGNPGKRPLNESEPLPLGDLADPPEWMTDDQKAAWVHAIECAPRGLLKKIDGSVFTAWVVAESLHRMASQSLAKSGLLMRAPNSGVLMQSPLLAIVNRQAQIMIKAAEQLGFSPSSRSRIQIDVEQKPSGRFRDL